MKLHDIAFKNILRRKSRAALVMIGIIAGTGSVVAVMKYTTAMTDQINHKMEKYGANIIITPKNEELTLSYGGFNAGGVSFGKNEITIDSLRNISHIKNAANIAAAGPVLIGSVTLNRKDVLAAGLDFSRGKILKPWWRITGTPPDGSEIISGKKAAKILGLKTGDSVMINKRQMKVSGILEETGSQDDSMIFMKLETAQSILGKKGKITMVEVAALCNACPINEMVAQISEKIPEANVMALQQIVAGRLNTLSQIKSLSITLSAIILAIGILVVFVTMMSNVRERRSEIGILRAIGYRKSHVVSIIMIETGILSLTGGIAGYIIGSISARIFASIAAGPEPLMIHSSPSGVVAAVMLALAAGLLAGFYPALAASNLDPAEALRSL